ncbi:MAG: ATP-binding cassette domain-containing protein [Firmicutes bacterium]|nr:ATP-binding cassette domain-containing protein [Bacillota bacterium]
MIQIRNVSITYKKDLRELVSNLSFVLNDGDKAAVIGEEGNGKSTLLKLIYDESMVSAYVEYEGEIIRNNSVLGYLGQELKPEEREKSVYEFLSEEPAFQESGPKELAAYAGRLRIPVSLLYSEQRMDTLSGGEKVKIAMVRILCRKPEALLLDEPSNDIDLNTLLWLEEFICGWKGPLLFISHDETLLERTANKIIHLEQVKKKKQARHTVKESDYGTYVRERAGGLKKQEQMAKTERTEYRKQQERFLRIEQKVEHQQETVSRENPHKAQMLKKKMHTLKSMERRYEKEYEQMTEMPDVEEAIFLKFREIESLPAGKTVLDISLPELAIEERVLARDIRLIVRGREKVCLTGDNGAGKSTLLKEIARRLLERKDLKAAYIPQNYMDREAFGERAGMTPVEFLSETGDKDEITRIRTYLGSLKYTADEMGHSVLALSGGQKAKLLLLRICMSGANVLILDEPTRNFSPLSGPVIRKMLAEFPGAIISISHDRKYIGEVCKKVYRLTEEGLVLAQMQ